MNGELIRRKQAAVVYVHGQVSSPNLSVLEAPKKCKKTQKLV
jgi:hypothetical protein